VKLGLENKKETAFLGVLVLLAGFLMYWNFFSGPSEPGRPAEKAAGSAANPDPAPPSISQADEPVAPRRSRSGNEEFHPVLHPKRAEDRIDPMKVDPTLHLEVLARLENAGSEGNGRNVFQFGPPPPPPPTAASRMKIPEPVVIPQQMPIASNLPPSAPPLPPIPLKFYGMSKVVATGKKHAFFKEADNIFIASEGDLLMNRYRVGRIGVNSVSVEDTQLKREQTLQLAGDADGSE
jgi:hypothetical protein